MGQRQGWINERILIGTFDTMRTNDEATQGYYLVKWITDPFQQFPYYNELGIIKHQEEKKQCQKSENQIKTWQTEIHLQYN